MPMIRCASGHYYDDGTHTSCPYCRGVHIDLGNTRGVQPREAVWPEPPSRPEAREGHDDHSDRTRGAAQRSTRDDSATMGAAAYRKRTSGGEEAQAVEPVVGWLVCVDGRNHGRDYRLRPGRNSIGRDVDNAVQITGDAQISRDAHAVVFYDYRSAEFCVYIDNGKNGIYVNGRRVLRQEHVLEPYDRIEIGETTVMFVPFCGESFRWSDAS